MTEPSSPPRRGRRGGSPRAVRPRRFRPFHRTVLHVEKTLGAGILVMLPVAVTILVLKFFFDLLSPIVSPNLEFIPYLPKTPGIGVALVLLLIYLAGLITSHVLGRRVVNVAHHIFEIIPVVKSIYGTTRTAVDLLSGTSKGRPYSAVVLIQFPHPGIQSIGLVTSRLETPGEEPQLAVFVPTTPIPSSGYLVIVPEKDATPTDISVDDAMKMVISGGILAGQIFRRHKFIVGRSATQTSEAPQPSQNP